MERGEAQAQGLDGRQVPAALPRGCRVHWLAVDRRGGALGLLLALAEDAPRQSVPVGLVRVRPQQDGPQNSAVVRAKDRVPKILLCVLCFRAGVLERLLHVLCPDELLLHCEGVVGGRLPLELEDGHPPASP